jgi:hypothetical protein
MSNMPTPFAGHFDGRGNAAVRYRVHRLMEEFTKLMYILGNLVDLYV